MTWGMSKRHKWPKRAEARTAARLTVVAASALWLAACATQGQGPQAAGAPGGGAAVAAKAVDLDRVLDRADAALKAGGGRDALAQYQLVLERDPANGRAQMGLAEIALASGQVEKARGLLVPMLDHPATGPRAHQLLGLAALKEGDLDAAVAELDAAVTLDPSLWRAWNGLGVAHDRRQDWAQADVAYDQALQAAPDEPVIHNNLGFSMVLRGRHDEAVRHLVKAAARAPAEEMPRVNLRLALAWQGRYGEAVAGAEGPELPVVLNNVGYVALLRGDRDEAEALLSRALEASPTYFTPARLNLNHLQSLADRPT